MPRKSLDELDNAPAAKPDAEVVVPASSTGIRRSPEDVACPPCSPNPTSHRYR